MQDETLSLPPMNSFWNSDTSDYVLGEKEKRTLLARMNREHSEAWEKQAEARRRWSKLEDYCDGRQVWDSKHNCLVGHEVAGSPSDENDVDDEFLIFNIVRRIHSSNVQRLSAYSIAPTVVPNSSGPDDKTGARMGRIALADLFNRIGEKKLKRRIATIIDKYGSVFLKTSFDPARGRLIHPIEINEMGKSFINEEKFVPEGEVIIEAFSPRNIILPRYCRTLDDADWIEEVHVESCDWVWRKFGIRIDAEELSFKDGHGPEATDTAQADVEWGQNTPNEAVVVKARYINPCPDFSRGAIIFYTKKHLLRCTDMLTYVDSLQDVWSSANAIAHEKTPLGTSWLWDIIPIQDALNTDLTAIVNHVKMYGDLQAQVPATANLKMDKVNNATANLYTYTGEKGMEYLKPPELQQSHFTVFNLLNSLSMSLGAAHDISRSNRAYSGNALATLQQIDDTVLRPALEDIGEALERSCKSALKLISEYYTNNRIAKMTGMKGWEIVGEFRGELLNGNFDAKISLMTGLSNNPIVRQESIYKALDKKVIDPTEARVYLEFGNAEQMLEEIQKEREISDKIVSGIASMENYLPDGTCKIVPHMWDNHALVIERLLVYMRENYDECPPLIKVELDKQLQWHQKVMAALASPALSPSPDSMTPEGGFGGGPAGNIPGPGLMKPQSKPGADSFQNPSQQPDRSRIPLPASTGLQNA